MSEKKIEIEDTVQMIIENSPNMFVIGLNGKLVTCAWFDKNQVLHTQVINSDYLKLVHKKGAK